MAYGGFKGGQQTKTPELIAIEEYHQDMAVARIIKINGGDITQLLKDAEMLLDDYWELFIEGTPREEKIKQIREKAKLTKNKFALLKGIRRILKGAAVEHGFYGQVSNSTPRPPKEK